MLHFPRLTIPKSRYLKGVLDCILFSKWPSIRLFLLYSHYYPIFLLLRRVPAPLALSQITTVSHWLSNAALFLLLLHTLMACVCRIIEKKEQCKKHAYQAEPHLRIIISDRIQARIALSIYVVSMVRLFWVIKAKYSHTLYCKYIVVALMHETPVRKWSIFGPHLLPLMMMLTYYWSIDVWAQKNVATFSEVWIAFSYSNWNWAVSSVLSTH